MSELRPLKKQSSTPRTRSSSSTNLQTFSFLASIISLAVAAIAAGFGIRAWYLTPGGGGHGPTYELNVAGELSQSGDAITLYATCSNNTGSVQVLQLEDGTVFNVYQKCPIPRNQCEMSLCDTNNECTTALVDPTGCADNYDCESYQQCSVANCTCYNTTTPSGSIDYQTYSGYNVTLGDQNGGALTIDYIVTRIGNVVTLEFGQSPSSPSSVSLAGNELPWFELDSSIQSWANPNLFFDFQTQYYLIYGRKGGNIGALAITVFEGDPKWYIYDQPSLGSFSGMPAGNFGFPRGPSTLTYINQ